ncbi:unnamed protein product [Auanema sp. JU1783]|nr:unnamed protein product [Auanema sp. JU1783]
MKAKRLDWFLSELQGFESPKIKLEQYATSPEMAVSIAECMDDQIDDGLEGKSLADLGCGCGMLMIATSLTSDLDYCLGIDVDTDALNTCRENINHAELSNKCDLLQADVLSLEKTISAQFDIVVTNPPFGTKNNAGLDMQFVQSGLSILKEGGSLFSLHKRSTRNYILKTANNWQNIEAECVAELRWELPATYKFHKKKAVDIEVDLIMFSKNV